MYAESPTPWTSGSALVQTSWKGLQHPLKNPHPERYLVHGHLLWLFVEEDRFHTVPGPLDVAP
jgi:hypothetical protein